MRMYLVAWAFYIFQKATQKGEKGSGEVKQWDTSKRNGSVKGKKEKKKVGFRRDMCTEAEKVRGVSRAKTRRKDDNKGQFKEAHVRPS